MDVSDRFVILQGGLALPVEPIMLALELESRGFSMTREQDGVLNVQPYQRLTREDCTRIRRWKHHILSLLDYTPPVAVQ
jgi:hypothetical protein